MEAGANVARSQDDPLAWLVYSQLSDRTTLVQLCESSDTKSLGSSVSGDSSTLFGGLRFSYGSNSIKEEERLGPIWSGNSRSF